MAMKEEWKNFLIPECFGSKTAGDSEKQTDCVFGNYFCLTELSMFLCNKYSEKANVFYEVLIFLKFQQGCNNIPG